MWLLHWNETLREVGIHATTTPPSAPPPLPPHIHSWTVVEGCTDAEQVWEDSWAGIRRIKPKAFKSASYIFQWKTCLCWPGYQEAISSWRYGCSYSSHSVFKYSVCSEENWWLFPFVYLVPPCSRKTRTSFILFSSGADDRHTETSNKYLLKE